jgi:uncharacterized protein YbcI
MSTWAQFILIILREKKIASEIFFASLYDEYDMARVRAIRARLLGVGHRAYAFPSARSDELEDIMKTLGEIEAAICQGMSRFEQEYMGRGPKDIRTHLIDDLVIVRLQGVLTAAEQHLVKSLPAEKGRDLLKQVRTHLLETARPLMEAMVAQITGVNVLSLHHDISTVTGEEVVLFTLAKHPLVRDVKKKPNF